MNVFITGGMGFIGSHIVVELLRHGHEVTVLARDPNKIPVFATTSGIRIVKGGLSNAEAIVEGLKGQDACIHNALFWGNTPLEMLQNDTYCAVRVFDLAVEAGVKHIVYTSSTAAFGPFVPRMDENLRITPGDFYGATKASTEAYLSAFSYQKPVRCNVVRPGYTIGNPAVEGAPLYSDVRFKNIVKAALGGDDIQVTGKDGTQFIAASDLANIYSAILHSDVNRGLYLGLAQDFTSWEEIARETVALTGSKSRVVVEDKGWGEPTLFDLGRIEREFGLAFSSKGIITSHLKYLIEQGRLS
jgi:UDP-glucose 4-epimerase